VFLYPLPTLDSFSASTFIELMSPNQQMVPELPEDNILKNLNLKNIDLLKNVYNFLTSFQPVSPETLKISQSHLGTHFYTITQ
jgi:hypothetical protein